ncbi:MAG: CBS domain-containing protein [Pseudomonadota bacterium]
MKIEQLMSSPPVTIDMDDTLDHVRSLFLELKFHHLLVVRHGVLRGVLSDRDLLESISHRVGTAAETRSDLDTLKRRVHQIMVRDPVSLGPNDTVRDAVKLFNKHGVSCLPVVNERNRPVGIVSWRDIMARLAA